MIIMVLSFTLCMLSVPINAAPAKPDTTWSVSFSLNMTKAVNQHVFSPDSDYVYLVMDGIQPLRLVPEPGYTYSALLFDQLDSGVTYNYKFRINDSVFETVNRSVKAQPGMVSVSAWWNNEPLNITTFIVNMQYAHLDGTFNPDTDSVCIVGTMNGMYGSPRMHRVDTTLNYSYTDTLLVPGAVQEYKYRINQGDTAAGHVELLNQPNRIVRIPDTLLTVTNDFNNFNPGKRLMTFNCDMGYFVRANLFDRAADYIDVAGNFNGSGANDALFDTDGDTIYSLGLYMDTTWFQQGPLDFKFRINGSWNSAELQGKPYRTYAFHDTINQNPNLYSCFYNNLDPSVPTPPWAYNADIQGVLVIKKILTGIYSYENLNGIPEGVSTYRWLRSSNAQGTEAAPIDTATEINYVVDTLDIGKWLVFEVTPKSVSGDSAVGMPVRAISSNSISAWDVGMGEHSGLITRVFPNPARDYISIEAMQQIDRVEVINFLNQVLLTREAVGSASIRLNLAKLPKGLYLLRAITKSHDQGVVRIAKY